MHGGNFDLGDGDLDQYEQEDTVRTLEKIGAQSLAATGTAVGFFPGGNHDEPMRRPTGPPVFTNPVTPTHHMRNGSLSPAVRPGPSGKGKGRAVSVDREIVEDQGDDVQSISSADSDSSSSEESEGGHGGSQDEFAA
jgi:hypothetical protein